MRLTKGHKDNCRVVELVERLLLLELDLDLVGQEVLQRVHHNLDTKVHMVFI